MDRTKPVIEIQGFRSMARESDNAIQERPAGILKAEESGRNN
jgi:hypothetical protein